MTSAGLSGGQAEHGMSAGLSGGQADHGMSAGLSGGQADHGMRFVEWNWPFEAAPLRRIRPTGEEPCSHS